MDNNIFKTFNVQYKMLPLLKIPINRPIKIIFYQLLQWIKKILLTLLGKLKNKLQKKNYEKNAILLSKNTTPSKRRN